jgi:hypothetical protein
MRGSATYRIGIVVHDDGDQMYTSTHPARRIPSQGKGTGSDHMTVDFICLLRLESLGN